MKFVGISGFGNGSSKISPLLNNFGFFNEFIRLFENLQHSYGTLYHGSTSENPPKLFDDKKTKALLGSVINLPISSIFFLSSSTAAYSSASSASLPA